MANMKLANWGAMIGLAAAWILIAGGIMALGYDRDWIGIYSICIGGLLIPLLWPFKFIGPLKAIFHGHYWLSSVLCALLSVISYFEVPTLLGGATLSIAAIVFAVAAWRGEQGAYFEKKR
ncbi:p22-like superoxide-generating NADPH oxidase light subunit [Cavenderia fasciculata]|uniref:p22-phox n=1 Tax=Cavenderia fasciculata TaxID=261658 RepID=F4Q627_CACFS|nr:p22-like superoxide-generating NADPH oxidase light subunit [Cavenderia fasciculata]EGG16613.1 p22-like superoxide-generating NADPH oxidase light subunit [Cavenderia fasciculata]|eukprot:XP_004355087.1 p22-like superoxide-generating NADPH oxidase light subunit [Cavenderia fasciculata]